MKQDVGRALFGYTPIAGGNGQRFFSSGTLAPLDDIGEAEPDPDEVPTAPQTVTPTALPLGLRLIAGDIAGRMVRRLVTHAEKAARSDTRKWLAEGINEHLPVIAEAFGPVVAACQDCGMEVPTAEGVADCVLARFVANPRVLTMDEVEQFRNHVIAFLSGVNHPERCSGATSTLRV